MNMDSYRAIKQEVVHKFARCTDNKRPFQFESASQPAPADYRLAIGMSYREPRQIQVELRVQQRGSKAHKAALDIIETACGEANLEFVPKLEIPTRSQLEQSTDATKVPGGGLFDPLGPGNSVSVPWGGTGTLGGFVTLENGEIGFISNNHVLARMGTAKTELTHGANADLVHQPGKRDVKWRRRSHAIGQVYDFIDLTEGQSHQLDVAVARLEQTRSILGNMATKDMGAPADITLGQPQSYVDLAEDGHMPVPAKIGRSTGYRAARVTGLDLTFTVGTPKGNRVFEGVTEITSPLSKPFSQPGDSGAVVFDETSGVPFGLHFAGGQKAEDNTYFSLCCSLPDCLEALNAKWI